MNGMQETIEAMLGSDGQLILTHQPRLPPGPVEVTIRVATPRAAKRALGSGESFDASARTRRVWTPVSISG